LNGGSAQLQGTRVHRESKATQKLGHTFGSRVEFQRSLETERYKIVCVGWPRHLFCVVVKLWSLNWVTCFWEQSSQKRKLSLKRAAV